MDKKMWITAVFILSWTNIKLTGEQGNKDTWIGDVSGRPKWYSVDNKMKKVKLWWMNIFYKGI